jgi:hypothetical protein
MKETTFVKMLLLTQIIGIIICIGIVIIGSINNEHENSALKAENAALKLENEKLKENKVAKVFNDWINKTDNPIDWNKMVDQIHTEHDLESKQQEKN